MTSGISTILDARQVELLRSDLAGALERHPGWPDLWNLRALLHAFTGNLDGARNAWQQALGRNPRYGAAHWSLQWITILSGAAPSAGASPDADDALLRVVRNLSRGAAPDPSFEPADGATTFALLAIAAARRDEDEVQRMAGALAVRDPGVPGLLEAAGVAKAGRLDERRLAELGRPGLLNPGYAELISRAAHLEELGGFSEESLRLLALAALIRGSRAWFLVRRAEAAGRRGKSETALRWLREAVEADPDWHESHAALGYELSLRGERDGALKHLEQAVRLRPEYADLQYQLGLLLHAAARNDEAAGKLRASLQISPSFHAARAALANVLFEEGHESDALPHYERLLEEGLDTSLLLGRLGYAAHAAGYRNRAEELFLDAISRNRNRAEVLSLYGLFLSDTDRRVEARAVWDRALDAGPSPALQERIASLRDEAAAD